ncbi:MAG: F0F1 ATP synthase subunit B [Phycisphaeraceae bacterium]|nr:F0F1 ATP synthase subunit B [Phycisphaeraceae bacterium]MBX3407915.1 F0F1 ATP synthase subunit B [Phycisphaeraceae bacterium]
MRRLFPLSAAAFLTLPASLALAAADESVGALPTVKQGLATGITGIIVFLLVLAILATKVWPTITTALDQRAEKIKEEIEAAELAQQQAREALQQYEKSLAQARAEAQKMLDDAKAQQQAIAADLKAKSDVELNAMRERAKRDIDSAKRAALAEIYAETSSLAASIAGKILQKEIRPQDQQRLVDESLAEFQAAHAN